MDGACGGREDHRVTRSPADLPEASEQWVSDFQRTARATGPDQIADISQAAPHPRRDLIACTLGLRDSPDDAVRRQVALVGGDGHRPVLPGSFASAWPVWSTDGSRLCVLTAAEEGDLTTAVVLDPDGNEIARAHGLGGEVEAARWSPDGRHLALVVADPGAEVSDVWGSGTVAGDAARVRGGPTSTRTTEGAAGWSCGTSEPTTIGR